MFITVQKPVSTPMRKIARLRVRDFHSRTRTKAGGAHQHRAKVDYCFGNLDERRLSSGPWGRDLTMQPPQAVGSVKLCQDVCRRLVANSPRGLDAGLLVTQVFSYAAL